MKVSKRRNISWLSRIVLFLSLTFLLLVPLPADCYAEPVEGDTPLEFHDHCAATGYYTMKDEADDSIIMKTARQMHVDDEYITGSNTHYIVEKVEGNTAWARSLGQIDLSGPPDLLGAMVQSDMLHQVMQAGTPITIAVYHSHGAEAYVPSDGEESIAEGGGILDVGDSFREALEQQGLEVKYSDETHVPHDAGAYNRSRRTVEKLMGEDAEVFFDVHRDAVPAEEYKADSTVQIQFVVGRQNHNVAVNREYAESLKHATDELHPNLIKGIFMARGSYNQDITPLALLLEVGSHENTKEGAEESIAKFAEAVNYYFAGPGEEKVEGAADAAVGGTALRTMLWVLLIALLASGAFLIISTGSIEEAQAKIRHFFEKEFAEFKGRKRK